MFFQILRHLGRGATHGFQWHFDWKSVDFWLLGVSNWSVKIAFSRHRCCVFEFCSSGSYKAGGHLGCLHAAPQRRTQPGGSKAGHERMWFLRFPGFSHAFFLILKIEIWKSKIEITNRQCHIGPGSSDYRKICSCAGLVTWSQISLRDGNAKQAKHKQNYFLSQILASGIQKNKLKCQIASATLAQGHLIIENSFPLLGWSHGDTFSFRDGGGKHAKHHHFFIDPDFGMWNLENSKLKSKMASVTWAQVLLTMKNLIPCWAGRMEEHFLSEVAVGNMQNTNIFFLTQILTSEI